MQNRKWNKFEIWLDDNVLKNTPYCVETSRSELFNFLYLVMVYGVVIIGGYFL